VYKNENLLQNEPSSVIVNVGEARGMDNRTASGFRRSPTGDLAADEIKHLENEIKIIDADKKAFRFNEGKRTGFSDRTQSINIRGDVFPDKESDHPRDRMSERAVLAHEYYGHLKFAPSNYEVGDWRDEMRASYIAAIKTPNLTTDDKKYLMLDAYERAREAGHYFEYSKKAREIIYGR